MVRNWLAMKVLLSPTDGFLPFMVFGGAAWRQASGPLIRKHQAAVRSMALAPSGEPVQKGCCCVM